jgi:hypothetical protein
MRGIEFIWIGELRPFFQRTANEILQGNEITRNHHPDFAKGVVKGVSKIPPLEKIGRFEHDWDLSRFLAAVQGLGKKDRLRRINEIENLLKRWGKLRNNLSHESFSRGAKEFSNQDLTLYITITRAAILEINGLQETSPRAEDIYSKLGELEGILTSSKR